MGRKKNVAMETVARPMMRGSITVIAAVAWFILSIQLFLVYLPQFGYYETIINAQGTTDQAVWYIWAWIPVLIILVIGIFWASGIIGKSFNAMKDIL
jgi:hypothetical protein